MLSELGPEKSRNHLSGFRAVFTYNKKTKASSTGLQKIVGTNSCDLSNYFFKSVNCYKMSSVIITPFKWPNVHKNGISRRVEELHRQRDFIHLVSSKPTTRLKSKLSAIYPTSWLSVGIRQRHLVQRRVTISCMNPVR